MLNAKFWRWASLAMLAALLLYHCASFAHFAATAVLFPGELTYTEGGIWNQAQLMQGARMYGPINTPPYVVFEYPPFYHALIKLAALYFGPFLTAGRMVSCLSLLVAAGAVGCISNGLIRPFAGKLEAATGAIMAALLVPTMVPVFFSAVVVTVDITGVALSLSGLALGILALRRPRLLYAAAFLCAAAVYTKQTNLAAPAALFVVFGLSDWRFALRAFAPAGIAGVAVAAWFTRETHGGFFQHILIYNMNPYSLHMLLGVVASVAKVAVIPLVAAILGAGLWFPLAGQAWQGGASLCHRSDPQSAMAAIMAAYSCLAIALSLLSGKTGAEVSYFDETLCLACIWCGVAIVAFSARGALFQADQLLFGVKAASVAPVLATMVPLLMCLHVAANLPRLAAAEEALSDPRRLAAQAALVTLVKSSQQAVVTDDLALPLLAGRAPLIEPFIFTQLIKSGQWESGLFLPCWAIPVR